jgi:hypothetical protein
MPGVPADFFVSYTSADRPWAEWIAWELECAGYSTHVQAWDMTPGSNFVLEMDAATSAGRMIAVLSPAFMESPFCRAEWAAAFREDPEGSERRLVPVRVRDCDPRGLLGSIVYVDVVGLSEARARQRLVAGVAAGRAKPGETPGFPGNPRRATSGGVGITRPSGGAAIFSVPVMTRTFVGRRGALERLEETLSDGPVTVTQTHAIHGLGGVGKTQLAARFARAHRDAYDVVWWLRAERPATLRADLAALATALGVVEETEDQKAAVDGAKRWLERNVRWLLVFDNASNPGGISQYVPEGTGGHVLITSRADADWRALGASTLPLDVFGGDESRELLRNRTGEANSAAIDALAEELGHLPLALEQAAAYANKRALTLSEYSDRLRTRASQLRARGQPLGYEHTVATVWGLAFDAIREHVVAAQLVGACAHLAPEYIPRGVLDAYTSQRQSVNVVDVDDAIEILLGYAVLTRSAGGALNMHRLVSGMKSCSPERVHGSVRWRS